MHGGFDMAHRGTLTAEQRLAKILMKPWDKQTAAERRFVAFHDPRQLSLFEQLECQPSQKPPSRVSQADSKLRHDPERDDPAVET
jgi:hypothetical protein